MAGLSEGYVIPRLATVCVTPPLVCDVPYGEGGAQQGRGAHAEHHLSDGKDNGSLRHLRDEYKLIFSARCIYCKSFHHPDKYCFRLSTFSTMARGRGRLAAESDSDSTSGSGTGGEDYGDASSVEDQSDSEDARTVVQDDLGPPFGQDLSTFYKSKKRIDSNEVKLVLQKETLAMFFDQLLANGRLDKEAAKELSKKYHMSDENYAQLSPPTLSSTKLHMIQSYDVGGVYNRLLTIHTHHRSALKIFLRVYESLGGTSQTFSDYLPVVPYNEDGAVNEEFVLPSKQDVLRELTEDDIAQVAPRDEDEWTQLIRDKLVLEKQNERQAGIIVGLMDNLQKANSMALLGQKLQMSISDLMWDGLQLYGEYFVFEIFFPMTTFRAN